MHSRRFAWAALSLAVAACQPPEGPTGAGGLRVRILHAAPGAPSLDVTLDGARVARGLRYGEATSFEEVPAGRQVCKLLDAVGQGAFAAQVLDLPAGSALTLVLATREARLEVNPLIDGFAPPREGHLRVRLLHAAPLESVAVDLGSDGSLEVPALAPGEATSPEGLELTANQAATLRLAGAGRFTVPALPSGSELLLVLTGVPAEPAAAREPLALLGVAPSAVLGFIAPESGVQ